MGTLTMNKTVLELINESYGVVPDADADSSGYGFDSEFNEPVSAADSNHSMEPENVAAAYFTEGDVEVPAEEQEEESFLFDDEDLVMMSPEFDRDVGAYFSEEMVDIATRDQKTDGEIPPGGVFMDEQNSSPPADVPVSAVGSLDSEVGKISAMADGEPSVSNNEPSTDDAGLGLTEALVLQYGT